MLNVPSILNWTFQIFLRSKSWTRHLRPHDSSSWCKVIMLLEICLSANQYRLKEHPLIVLKELLKVLNVPSILNWTFQIFLWYKSWTRHLRPYDSSSWCKVILLLEVCLSANQYRLKVNPLIICWLEYLYFLGVL